MLVHRQIELTLNILRQDSLLPQQGCGRRTTRSGSGGHPARALVVPFSTYEAGEIDTKWLILYGGP